MTASSAIKRPSAKGRLLALHILRGRFKYIHALDRCCQRDTQQCPKGSEKEGPCFPDDQPTVVVIKTSNDQRLDREEAWSSCRLPKFQFYAINSQHA